MARAANGGRSTKNMEGRRMYKIIAVMMLTLAVAACSGGGDESAKESMEKAGEAMKEAGAAAGEGTT